MSGNSNEEVPTTVNGSVAAATDNEAVTSRLLSDAGISGISALSSHTSASDSPSQSESTQPCESSPGENAPPAAASEEPAHPANRVTSNQRWEQIKSSQICIRFFKKKHHPGIQME